jgi:hypothetical protein
MKKVWVVLSLVVFSLAACQTTDKKSSRTIGGTNLGTAEWTTVEKEDGKLILPRKLEPNVVKSMEKRLPDRYIQAVSFKNGRLWLELLYRGGFLELVSKKSFLRVFRSRSFYPAPTTDDVQRSGYVTYLATTEKNKPCVAFRRGIGKDLGYADSVREGVVSGHYCERTGYDANKLTSEVLKFVAQIKIDTD